MPEYAKMKNADLEALLKTRGLPTGGKKADMVERLTKDDEKATDTTAPAASNAAAVHPEDEIDWDDDEPTKPAAELTTDAKPTETTATEPSTTVEAAGTGQSPNPQAVSDQVTAIDSLQTDDVAAKEPVDEEKAEAGAEPEPEENNEPPPDYSRGLAASTIDDEIEKRKARAKKFGLNVEDDEGLRKLERAKKFGETGPPKGLDEALPERNRKRARDDQEDGGRNKRRGGGRFGGRPGRGRGNRDGDRRRDNRDNRDDRGDRREERGGGRSSWMNAADKEKAEARKKKWAAPAA